MKLLNKKYCWDGYWETCYLLSEFNPDEEIDIQFEDELSEEPEPKMAQLNAMTFIINNQIKILSSLYNSFLAEYDKWKVIYEDHLPVMRTACDVKDHIKISSIYIDIPEKNGQAYIGYCGSCSWDDEHGIGFYTHNLDVLEIGESSVGFSGVWNAYKDLGIEKQIEFEIEENKNNPKFPKIYKPHHTYGLKPSQEEANKGYYYHLIERGFNEAFINHFNQGDINTETRTGYINISFLERACQINNNEIVEFLLSKNPIETKGCLKQACYNLNLPIIKMLVEHGIDINEQDEWFKDYPIQNVISSIGRLVSNNESQEKYLQALNTLKWMLNNGANSKIILKPANEFDKLEYSFLDEKTRKEILKIIRSH